jgi:glycosyltransferase involved in cell wall biosynthesis
VRESWQQRANEILPPNATAHFPGYTNQLDLYDFYCGNPMDVFVNTSLSEGTPVSIMEAVSCGIPVIATAVGGNTEIVTSQNGILLGAHPRPDDMAQALFWFIDHPAEARAKRTASQVMWKERYNARRNFEAFAERLIELRNKA